MARFIDEAHIIVRSGKGGNGCISFRREKFVPKGGPNGGDGGKGGDIVLVTDGNLSSLLDFRYKKIYKAENGENGRGKNQHGKNGSDLIIPVPLGTMIINSNSGEIIADLTIKDQKIVVANGGYGGKGNARFASSTNQTPRYAEPGKEGKEYNLTLELKLLADIGIIGFPNVGKSTLISKISAAKPKIADYPFTTLIPNLGVVSYDEGKTFIVADIPGIIEGAHEGTGLGIEFLKHVERTEILLHLIDISPLNERDPVDDYEKLNAELSAFSKKLAEKPQIIAANKIDVNGAKEKLKKIMDHFEKNKIEVQRISAVTGEGVNELLYKLAKKIEKRKN